MLFSPILGFIKGIFARLARYPVISFFVLLLVLFGIVFLAHKYRTPAIPQEVKAPTQRNVPIFTIGVDVPKASAQSEVKETGTIDIVAVVPGIVKRLSVKLGQKVQALQTIAELTSDYGANAAGIRAQIAREQAGLTQDTASLNKKLLELQTRLAKSQASQTTATAPQTQKKIADANLKVQKKNLSTNNTLSDLGTALASAEEMTLRPRTLQAGTIISLPIIPGDYVAPGTVLATLATPISSGTLLEVHLPTSLAKLFDPNGRSDLRIGNTHYELEPRFFSPTEDNQGLVTIQFETPEVLRATLTNHSFVDIEIALDQSIEGGALIPLDALFQGNGTTSVLILDENGVAQSKTVSLEEVMGNFALVTGLGTNDRIITDRLTVAGEHVQPIQE